ncbi:MAG: hypothetical protein E6R08_04025 [Nevskiaceae bacterium]|nr:MAG: hypothetical protein E6R08_04025 [Nevskiaceae bacterium]
MNIRQIANFVIRPTLTYIGQGMPGFASDAAVELLLGTMAHESRFEFLDQVTGPNDTTLGPAIGFYQIEPATCRDIFETYLNASSRRGLSDRVLSLLAARPAMDDQLAGNLNFATAIARLKYWRSPEPLASPGDIAGHARVWKRVYNTVNGAGREADFINAYQRLVAPYL